MTLLLRFYFNGKTFPLLNVINKHMKYGNAYIAWKGHFDAYEIKSKLYTFNICSGKLSVTRNVYQQ